MLGDTDSLNPCPKHPEQEISHLVKTTKEGACDMCIKGPDRFTYSHLDTMPLGDAVREGLQVLELVEGNLLLLINECQPSEPGQQKPIPSL